MIILTPEQETEVNNLRAFFPYRIIYVAQHKQTKEFLCSAVQTMRIPNNLARNGWEVGIVKNGRIEQ